MFPIFNKIQKPKKLRVMIEKVKVEDEVLLEYELNFQQNCSEAREARKLKEVKKEAESNQLCLLFEQPKMTKPIKIKSENPLRIKSNNNRIYTFKYSCPHCDATFISKEKRRKHVFAHKIKEECKKCHMKFLGEFLLIN